MKFHRKTCCSKNTNTFFWGVLIWCCYLKTLQNCDGSFYGNKTRPKLCQGTLLTGKCTIIMVTSIHQSCYPFFIFWTTLCFMYRNKITTLLYSEGHSLLSLESRVLTFFRRPLICSYLPVESGRFSKLMTSQMFTENLSAEGSLANGDTLWSIGVPRSTDLVLPMRLFGVLQFGVVSFNCDSSARFAASRSSSELSRL